MNGSPSAILTLGFGSWGSVGLNITLGFGNGFIATADGVNARAIRVNLIGSPARAGTLEGTEARAT